MADETLRFDIVGNDNLSGPFSRAGRATSDLSAKMDAAAVRAKLLDDVLRGQLSTAGALSRADRALADQVARPMTPVILTDKAAKALDDIRVRADKLRATFPQMTAQIDDREFRGKLALMAAGAKAAGAEIDKALKVKVTVDDSALAKLQKQADAAKAGGPPAVLGAGLLALPAVTTLAGVAGGAAIGLGGAAVAGAGALLAYGAVAKGILADTMTAQAQIINAQNVYAGQLQAGVAPAKAWKTEQTAIDVAYAKLGPNQIALTNQLMGMANAWDDLKNSVTPVVSSSLQPWLKGITDLTKSLLPVITQVSPVIRDLGTQFDGLINSPAFRGFRDFIAGTGSAAVGAVGGTLIGFVKGFMILLPQFNPLIQKTVEWIGDLGPAFAKWASGKQAAADITKFMNWFSTNGPVVGGLLKNIGGALATLAPGLTSGGAIELKVISDFFGWVAKLPKGIAAPLAEAAGALILLNKLGVFSVGVKFTGLAAGWISKLLGGATVDIGAVGMQKAADTMVLAAAAMQKAAGTMVGAGAAEVTAGTEQGAAGAAEVTAGGLFAGASPAMAALGAGLLAAVAYEGIKSAGNVLNYFKGAGGGGVTPALNPGGTTPGGFTSSVPPAAIASTATQNAGQDATYVQTYATRLKDLNDTFTSQATIARDATTQLGLYTAAVKAGGTASQASKTDAAALDFDLQNAGLSAARSKGDIAAYTKAIQQNGINSSQAAGARRQIVSDILAAAGSARQGQTDLKNYTADVQDNSTKSAQGRADRAALIKDLENAGLSAQAATTLVNGLSTSVTNLPAGKTIKISMDGTGVYTISGGVATSTATGSGGGMRLTNKAAGGYVSGGAPGRDSVAALLMPGELVIPVHMVRAGVVDHLRGMLPGFASGGMVAGNLTPAYIGGMYDTFQADMTDAMVTAMRAAIKAAAAAAKAASAVSGGGGSNAANIALAKKMAAAAGWTGAQWTDLLAVIMRESGGSSTVVNPSSGAAGIAQNISGFGPGYAKGNAAQQIAWMISYIKGRYGTPAAALAHENAAGWYAGGGLVPGYAAGGVVGSTASRGAAYLKGWRKSEGTVNAQIGRWTRAQHVDDLLAGAAGLSSALHAKYARAAAGDRKTLAGLGTELTVLRDWRTQLAGSDASLTAWIGAAGKTPALKGNVAAWKKQLAAQKATIGGISAMLGLTGAQLAADAASAKAAAAASAASAAAVAAAGAAGGSAGTTAAAAATTAAAVPLTAQAALALLTGTGTGAAAVPAIPGLTGPGAAGGTFSWPGGAFPWPGAGSDQGGPGMAMAPRGGTGASSSGPDPLAARLDQLIAEVRNLTGVAAGIPRATGQHVGAAVSGAAGQAAFRVRYP